MFISFFLQSFVFENNDGDVMDSNGDSNLSVSSSSSLRGRRGGVETEEDARSKTTTPPTLIDLLLLTEDEKEDKEEHKEEKQGKKRKIEKQQNRARTNDDNDDDDTTHGSSSSNGGGGDGGGRRLSRVITLMNRLTEERWTELTAVTSRWSPSTQRKHAWTLTIWEAHCAHHKCLPALPLNLQRHNVGAFVQWLILDVGYALSSVRDVMIASLYRLHDESIQQQLDSLSASSSFSSQKDNAR
ncbi:hypothetical protein QOT17_003345 [Balamuthia mandrillaris]